MTAAPRPLAAALAVLAATWLPALHGGGVLAVALAALALAAVLAAALPGGLLASPGSAGPPPAPAAPWRR